MKRKNVPPSKKKNLSRPSLNKVPPFSIMEIMAFDADGNPLGALVRHEKVLKGPLVPLTSSLKDPSFSLCDRLLVQLESKGAKILKGEILRILEKSSQEILGIFQESRGRTPPLIFPTDRRLKESYRVREEDAKNLKSGDLVKARLSREARIAEAQILDVLGHASDPKLFSLIALYEFEIPHHFNKETLHEAQHVSKKTTSLKREDLTSLPLVTIDGEDARDFDDAVWAEADSSPENEGGFHLIVAIADVAFYIQEGSFLDQTAFERGNSVYFPDRVVPMLPEALSNDVCSLKPHVPRYTLAVHLWINKSGKLLKYRFTRALIQSAARLTYTQVQEVIEGKERASSSLPEKVKALIPLLYRAFKALLKARQRRGTLDFELPERSVIFNEQHQIEKIIPKPRLQSHCLIEEFMILANVAAASVLSLKNFPCMYRVHDKPSLEKIENLRKVLKPLNLSLPPQSTVAPSDLDKVLKKSKDFPQHTFIHELVLRSQAQALYSPHNIGHFGLHLTHYAHFTSPIRRYADVLVHRALIKALDLGEDGLSLGDNTYLLFEEIGAHISQTERRAMQAERATLERYITSFMEDHLHAQFEAYVSGIHRSGIFVELRETGANGFIPKHFLPYDHYIYHEKLFTLQGRHYTFKIGDPLDVTLLEANAHTNSLLFSPLNASKKTKKNASKGDRKRKKLFYAKL